MSRFAGVLSLLMVLVPILACSRARMGREPFDCERESMTLKESKWFHPATHDARGVVLLVHGLNLKPSRMDSLAELIRKQGYEVLRLALSGHHGDLEEFKKVSAEQWLGEAAAGYCLGLNRSRVLGKPLLFVGFSLGGLLGETLLNTSFEPPVAFEKVVLIAPAISVRARSHLVRALRVLGSSYVVSSGNSEAYRAGPGTPIAAYDATFDLISELSASGFARSNVPTIVFLAPEDELVDSSGVAEIREKFALTRWKLIYVSNAESVLPGKRHHLFIDESSAGPRQWNEMSGQITRFLR